MRNLSHEPARSWRSAEYEVLYGRALLKVSARAKIDAELLARRRASNKPRTEQIEED